MSSSTRTTFGNLTRLLIIAAWMLGFLWLLSQDRYRLFIRAELWPLLAGALLMLVAFFAAVYFRLDRPASHSRGLAERGVQVLLLLLPLAYMVGATRGPGLGSSAFAMRRVDAPAFVDGPTRAKPGDGAQATILDLYYDRESYAGKHVSIDGIVYAGEDGERGHLTVFRFVIVCCAADAIPVSVLVYCDNASEFAADSWVRVDGTVELQDIDGDTMPTIRAERIANINPPSDIYLSPW